MARPLWFVNLLKRSFPSRFQVAQWTNLPGIGPLMDRLMFGDDNIIYLPKDTVIPIEVDLDPQSTVLPSQVISHFIEEANFHWIMNGCICREATPCADYPRDLGCLFLGSAALDINPALGRPATPEEAHAHIQRGRDEGLVHLIGRNKIDTLWLGVGPGDKLMTICQCCPCCCLWRVLPDVSTEISSKVQRMPGVSVTVTEDCIGCGTCVEEANCFAGALYMNGDCAVITEDCRGCGRCVEACPQDAITLAVDNAAYVQTAIDQLRSAVDVT